MAIVIISQMDAGLKSRCDGERVLMIDAGRIGLSRPAVPHSSRVTCADGHLSNDVRNELRQPTADVAARHRIGKRTCAGVALRARLRIREREADDVAQAWRTACER